MAIDFPNNPDVGQTFSAGGRTWSFNGVYWNAISSVPPSFHVVMSNETGIVTTIVPTTITMSAVTLDPFSCWNGTNHYMAVPANLAGVWAVTCNSFSSAGGVNVLWSVTNPAGNLLYESGSFFQNTSTTGAELSGGTLVWLDSSRVLKFSQAASRTSTYTRFVAQLVLMDR